MSRWRKAVLAFTVVLLLAAAAAGAFFYLRWRNEPPAPSQLASVTQRIARTDVVVDYSRPVARGRVLFGNLVKWGEVWNPGANQATSIAFSTPVRVNGQELDEGKYSLWVIPQPDSWTLIFSRAADVFHIPYPAGQDALRLAVTPRQGPHMESLAFYFPVVEGKGAELVLHWGNVVVPLQLAAP